MMNFREYLILCGFNIGNVDYILDNITVKDNDENIIYDSSFGFIIKS
jgi:hypothetical protein